MVEAIQYMNAKKTRVVPIEISSTTTRSSLVSQLKNLSKSDVTVWIERSIDDDCDLLDVASLIVREHFDVQRQTLLATDLQASISRHFSRDSLDSRERILTWRKAVEKVMLFVKATKPTKVDPLSTFHDGPDPLSTFQDGPDPLSTSTNPNPFYSAGMEVEKQSHSTGRKTNKDWLLNHVSTHRICFATIDDVKMSLKDDSIIDHYFSLSFSLTLQTLQTLQTLPGHGQTLPGHGTLDIEKNSEINSMTILVDRWSLWSQMDASMRVTKESLRGAFLDFNLSKTEFLRWSEDERVVEYRFLEVETHEKPSDALNYLLKRPPSSDIELSWISMDRAHNKNAWVVTWTLHRDSEFVLEIEYLRGTLSMQEIDGKMKEIMKCLQSVVKSIGWETMPCFMNWRTSNELQELVGIDATVHLNFEGSPDLLSIANRLKMREFSQDICNLESYEKLIFGQCRRVNSFMELTKPEVFSFLNRNVPSHILVNLISQKYNIDRKAASSIIESRDLSPPTIFVLKEFGPTSFVLKLKSFSRFTLLNEIVDMIARASKVAFTLVSTLDNRESIVQDGVFDLELDLEIERDIHSLDESRQSQQSQNSQNSQNSRHSRNKDRKSVQKSQNQDVRGRYMINELHRADPLLFDTGNRLKNYSRICSLIRQPIPVSQAELEPGQLYVSTGSSDALAKKNRYICPTAWCPKSRVALTLEEIEAARVESRHACPDPNEVPLVFDEADYWKGRTRYPGYLDPKFHKNGLCMPCCFLKPDRKVSLCRGRVDNVKDNNENVNENVKDNNENVEDGVKNLQSQNERYIHNDGTKLPNMRFGYLPSTLHALFNAHSRCLVDSNVKIANLCVLRAGVTAGPNNVYDAFSRILNVAIIDAIEKNLDTKTFLSLHSGVLALMFVPKTMKIAVESPWFDEWFRGEGSKDIRWKESIIRLVEDSRDTSLGDPERGDTGRGDPERRDTSLGDTERGDTSLGDTETISKTLEASRNYVLNYSMRMYVETLKAVRTHDLVIDLVNKGLSWLNPLGIYVVVLIQDSIDSISVSCPRSTSIARGVTTAFLLKGPDAHYEAVCTVRGKRGDTWVSYAFDSQSDVSVKTIKAHMEEVCRQDAVSKLPRPLSIWRALKNLDVEVVNQVVNFELKCVAFLTREGVMVPLPKSDHVVTSIDLPIVFLDSLEGKFRDSREFREDKQLLARLAETLGEPRLYDSIVEPRNHPHSLHVLVNMPVRDLRLLYISRLDERALDIQKLHKRFLASLQKSPEIFENVIAVVSPSSPLPWDVRHKYLTYCVERFVGPKNAAEVSDNILLGIHRRGSIWSTPVGQLLVPANDLDGVFEKVEMDVTHISDKKRRLKPPKREDLLSVTRKSRKSIVPNTRTRIEISYVPLTLEITVSIAIYANRILNPEAPVTPESLKTLIKSVKKPVDALKVMASFLSIPLVFVTTDKVLDIDVTNLSNSFVLMVHDNDLILTRQNKHELYKMIQTLPNLTSIKSR